MGQGHEWGKGIGKGSDTWAAKKGLGAQTVTVVNRGESGRKSSGGGTGWSSSSSSSSSSMSSMSSMGSMSSMSSGSSSSSSKISW